MAGKPDELLPSASDFMKKFAVAQAEEASKQAWQHAEAEAQISGRRGRCGPSC